MIVGTGGRSFWFLNLLSFRLICSFPIRQLFDEEEDKEYDLRPKGLVIINAVFLS